LQSVSNTSVAIVSELYPTIKEAERYYGQDDYKDDHMARGKALHPLLVTGFDKFAVTDQKLRQLVDAANKTRSQQHLAAIEAREGRTLRFYSVALIVQAKERADTITGPRDIARISAALTQFEKPINTIRELRRNSEDDDRSITATLSSNSGAFLRSAKVFMRRVRDKVPYNIAERSTLGFAGGIGDWMVEGSRRQSRQEL